MVSDTYTSKRLPASLFYLSVEENLFLSLEHSLCDKREQPTITLDAKGARASNSVW